MGLVPSMSEYTGPYSCAHFWYCKWTSRAGTYFKSATWNTLQCWQTYKVEVAKQGYCWGTWWQIRWSTADKQQSDQQHDRCHGGAQGQDREHRV